MDTIEELYCEPRKNHHQDRFTAKPSRYVLIKQTPEMISNWNSALRGPFVQGSITLRKTELMKLPLDTPQVIEYHCNICGGRNQLESHQFSREGAICEKCGANARFRGIIHILANLLEKGENTNLQEWQIRKHIFGIGMSDSPGYANLLKKKFSYENTFFDHEPKLDIIDLAEKYLGKYDFVISTEVFEHILPPLQHAFDNLFRLLRPGGCLVFSVPYTCTAPTVEHFPGLREYEILILGQPRQPRNLYAVADSL
jgi:SAM-dependent methyltransferase